MRAGFVRRADPVDRFIAFLAGLRFVVVVAMLASSVEQVQITCRTERITADSVKQWRGQMAVSVEQADAVLRAMHLVDDLNYLQAEAFHFSLEVNPHTTFHMSVTEWLQDCDDRDDDWVSLEQQGKALSTQRFLEARIYPTTSIGFCTVRGTDLADVVRRSAEACREYKAAAARP